MKDSLTAGDICIRTVVVGDAAMAVDEAARLMRKHQVGCLVIVEEIAPGQRAVVGMLTDRDIVTTVVASARDATLLRVGDVMTRDVITAREADSILDVLGSMRRKGVRRIPVTGPQRMLIGLVALDDVLAVVALEMQAIAAAVGAPRGNAAASRPG